MTRSGNYFAERKTGQLLFVVWLFAFANLNEAAGAGEADANLTVTGLANGTLVVTWSQPTVTQPSGDKSLLPVDTYVLQYKTTNASDYVTVQTKDTSYNIPNAYLGADYTLLLTCMSNTNKTKCGGQNISAYPSCPKGLSQQKIQCYYMSVTKTSFQTIQRQCQSLLSPASGSTPPTSSSATDFSNMVTQDIQTRNQSVLWMVTDDCLNKTADQLTSSKCCVALKPNTTMVTGSPGTSSNKYSQLSFSSYDTACPAATVEMAFICGQDMPAVTPKPENLTYSVFPNNSVRITWQEQPQGWTLVWRTITVRNFFDKTLVQTLVTPNAQSSAVLAPLAVNNTYTVQIWPDRDGTLMNNTAYSEFALIGPRSSSETNGGVMRHPLVFEALRLSNGSLRLSWEAGLAFKENTVPYKPDGYNLHYGPISITDNTLLPRVNLIDTYSFVIASIVPDIYKFYLRCVFGTVVFTCGRIVNYTVDGQSDAKLAVTGLANGTLVVTWTQPMSDKNLLPVDTYVFQYKTTNASDYVTVETKNPGYNIPNAYLGADYTLKLTCMSNNTKIKCGSQNISAYPSCPTGLSQQKIQCYFMSVAKASYQTLQRQCQSLLSPASGSTPLISSSTTDFSNMVTQDIQTKNQSVLWLATDDCLYKTADQIATSKCCVAMRPNVTGATSQGTAANKFSQLSFTSYDTTCPAATVEMAFICGQDMPAVIPNPENMTYSVFPNNSARVTWQERYQGWTLVWRTITVRNFTDQTLLQTLVVPNIQSSVVLAPLAPNNTYSVQIWPDRDGTLLSNVAQGGFVLIAPRNSEETNGGVMRHPSVFEATLFYNGSLRLTWEVGVAFKDSTVSISADSYRLYYGLMTTSRSDMTQINLTDTSYVLQSVGLTSYKFFLKCVFGTNIFVCGRILNYTVATPLKGRTDVDKYVVYDVPIPAVPASWSDAENQCKRNDGHLVSITSDKEEAYQNFVIQKNITYWFGATNCASAGSGNPQWTDGTPWNFSRLGTAKDSSACCAAGVFQSERSNWTMVNCSSRNLFYCKYVVKDHGLLQNLAARPLAGNAFNITWQNKNNLWNTTYNDAFLYNLNKSTTKPAMLPRVFSTQQIILPNLERNTAYRINVTTYVTIFTALIQSTITFMTGPILSVATNVSANGQIDLKWPGGSQTSNESSVVYVIQPTDPAMATMAGQANPPYKVITNNNTTSIQGLQLGASYNFTLLVVDNKTGLVYDSTLFTVTNQPSCRSNEYQMGMLCYWVAATSIVWDDTEKTCAASGGDMVMVRSPAEGTFLQQLASSMGTPFWIDGQMSSLNQYNQAEISVTNSTNLSSQHADQEVKRVVRDAASQCRIITNNMTVVNGQSWAQCNNKLPVMCERTLQIKVEAVSNVMLKNISSTTMLLVWDGPKWKPFSYNVNVSQATTSAQRGKRDVGATNASSTTAAASSTTGRPTTTTPAPPPPPTVTMMNNSVLVGNLQPSTEYVVDISPVVKRPTDAAPINGDHKSVRVVTLGPNETAPSQMQALELNGPPGSDDNVTLPVVADGQLNTFRLISSVLLVVLVLIALVIMLICRMYRFRDCLDHMFFAIALLLAHILILLDVNNSDQINCRAVAICVHFFFTVAFLFFALECFCHLKTMTSFVPLGMLNRSWQHFVIGWGIPIVIIIISAASVPDEYVIKNRTGHCWVNLETSAMLATVIPIGIFAGLALVFLGLAIVARPKDNYEVDEESYIRYDPMQDIRWMLLFILALLISHWALGMIAVHTEDGNYFIGFIVLTIILGISILLLRCIGDDEVRLRLRKCCQGTPIEPNENEIGREKPGKTQDTTGGNVDVRVGKTRDQKSQDKMKIFRSSTKVPPVNSVTNSVTLMSRNYPKHSQLDKQIFSNSVWKVQNQY